MLLLFGPPSVKNISFSPSSFSPNGWNFNFSAIFFISEVLPPSIQFDFSILPVITSLCVAQSAPTEIAVCLRILACAGVREYIFIFFYSNFLTALLA